MLTQRQADTMTNLIKFDKAIWLGDMRDFDFNKVVEGLYYEELIIKLQTVEDDWWKNANVQRH